MVVVTFATRPALLMCFSRHSRNEALRDHRGCLGKEGSYSVHIEAGLAHFFVCSVVSVPPKLISCVLFQARSISRVYKASNSHNGGMKYAWSEISREITKTGQCALI